MTVSRLPVVPRPLPDEHLTAWFGRVAGVYSMSSLELLDHITDQAGGGSLSGALSHHPTPESLAVLSRSLGMPVQTLSGLTVPRLRPLWGKAFRTDWTVGPPPLHCPVCLAGDEAVGRPHHLRVDWTCALAFHCPVHDIELLLGCPACRHTGLVFSGPPAAARLHCALCRTRLGTRSVGSLTRCHKPGRWPAADRRQGPDPQATHEAPFRTFVNAVLRALAWTPRADAVLGTGCPAAVRSTLVGLLQVFGLPVRNDDTSLPRLTLAQTIRLPWVRMVPSEWPQATSFADGFASLAAPTRFDLMVAVYALLSGAQDLLSCRRWRLRHEDWRVYCMGDPIAQALGAVAPEAGAMILERTKQWVPTAARRFWTAHTAMREMEEQLRETVARRQDRATAVPITGASLEERYCYYRKLGKLSDYDLLTVEDMLTVPSEPAGYDRNVTIEEALGFSRARPSVQSRDDAIRALPSDAGPPDNPSVRNLARGTRK
ncbi:TniQ family protein [Azospirillum argentinense]